MNVKKELTLAGIRPDKKSGQNFLIDQGALKRIVESADIKPADTILEAGAGPGNLTVLLAGRAKRVIAVENDERLIPILKNNTSHYSNIELAQDDIFHWRLQNPDNLKHLAYKVVSNLPYYLTSRFLRVFLSSQPKPSEMILLIQQEVADRLSAQAGSHSLLSISVQYYSKVKKMFDVSYSSFWPSPEVNSSVIRITDIKSNQEIDEDVFRLIKIGFSSRRKQLQNNLRSGLRCQSNIIWKALSDTGLSELIRPQELAVKDWINLHNNLIKVEKSLK